MFDWLKRLFSKSAPASSSSSTAGWDAPFAIDSYRRVRPPTPLEILQELKNVAYSCATFNASTCASYQPKLYVKTGVGQRRAKCLTKSLTATHPLVLSLKGQAKVEEVLEHPLLSLFQQVNAVHNAQDLWELTTLYQEVHGTCYWLLENGVLGVPSTIWLLPAHMVTPRREKGSDKLIGWYEYRVGNQTITYQPEEIIRFTYPDPRDPYLAGLSPLRAAFELVALGGNFLAYRRAVLDNHAMPGVIVSPGEVMGQEEAERLETQWNQKFRKGGNGRVMVAESNVTVQQLGAQLGDVAALAEAGATKEDIANAFGVPLAFLTSESNLANLQAAERQHAKIIYPKLQRRDQKLNEQLIPRYDTSGRLFLASDDPRPHDREFELKQENIDLTQGVRVINEIRAERGLPPVPWGDTPYSKPRITEQGDLPADQK